MKKLVITQSGIGIIGKNETLEVRNPSGEIEKTETIQVEDKEAERLGKIKNIKKEVEKIRKGKKD